jgi:hypothetical protein
MTKRQTVYDDWGEPRNLGPTVNSLHEDNDPDLFADGSALLFTSDRPGGCGGWDIWQASITPAVDFDGNGWVDVGDLLRLIESWGQGDSSCDIGPTVFGDGVVDAADLEVLMNYWGQEVQDDTLMAHWKLDETEGMIASDSAGQNDGTVIGVPAWQPADGAVDGALEFDGTTFVVTESILNPSDGAFSVFAWVRGGTAGQAIISQVGGANWLMVDASGVLITELKNAGRFGTPLFSDTVVTGGPWHRVGFTWDGAIRSLYVDDVLVAQDTDTGLADGHGGLNIGCGKDMTPGSFWSGLIDDVRIYNRVVKP